MIPLTFQFKTSTIQFDVNECSCLTMAVYWLFYYRSMSLFSFIAFLYGPDLILKPVAFLITQIIAFNYVKVHNDCDYLAVKFISVWR